MASRHLQPPRCHTAQAPSTIGDTHLAGHRAGVIGLSGPVAQAGWPEAQTFAFS